MFRVKEITDESIFLSSLADGSPKAFDALFVTYYPKALQFVMHFCHDRQEAENIVQDFFMNLWIKRSTLDDISNLDNYIYVSVRNAAIRYVKQSIMFADSNSANVIPANGESADVRLCYEELYGYVMREIQSMPEQRRRIFLMSRADGLSNDDIAQRLGISKRTVEKHISLAIATMRKMLPELLALTLLNF